MKIYKTDLHCVRKNEFAYFVKFKNKFICVATSHNHSFWELTTLAELSEIDLIELTEKRFFNKSNYESCKEKLQKEFIELFSEDA